MGSATPAGILVHTDAAGRADECMIDAVVNVAASESERATVGPMRAMKRVNGISKSD
jgi:hypothetical protein